MLSVKNKRVQAGFTIVELVMVMIIIAILATVVISAYRNSQRGSKEAALQKDLKEAKLYLAAEFTDTGVYPDTANIPKSDDTIYEMTSSGDMFCLTARADGVDPYHIDQDSEVSKGPCYGHDYGYATPVNVNIAPPLSQWTLSTGATVTNGELYLPAFVSGSNPKARSIFLKVDEATGITFSFEMKPTAANNRLQWSSFYYGADKVSRPTNTQGYIGNGFAPTVSTANVWTTKSSSFALGPGIHYVILEIWTNATYNGPTYVRNLDIRLIR